MGAFMPWNTAPDSYTRKQKGSIFIPMDDYSLGFSHLLMFWHCRRKALMEVQALAALGLNITFWTLVSFYIMDFILNMFSESNLQTFLFRFQCEHCGILFVLVWKWSAVYSDGALWSQLIHKQMPCIIYRRTSVRCFISGEPPFMTTFK